MPVVAQRGKGGAGGRAIDEFYVDEKAGDGAAVAAGGGVAGVAGRPWIVPRARSSARRTGAPPSKPAPA